jgi:hypothetical protein
VNAKPPAADTRWVRLGVVGRPHGVRGAMKVHLDNPRSTALRGGLRVRLTVGSASDERVLRSASGGAVVFDGIDDRDAALALTHAVVEVRKLVFYVMELFAHHLHDWIARNDFVSVQMVLQCDQKHYHAFLFLADLFFYAPDCHLKSHHIS